MWSSTAESQLSLFEIKIIKLHIEHFQVLGTFSERIAHQDQSASEELYVIKGLKNNFLGLPANGVASSGKALFNRICIGNHMQLYPNCMKKPINHNYDTRRTVAKK